MGVSVSEKSIAEGGGLICIAPDATFCNLSSLPTNYSEELGCFYRLPIPDQCFMEGGEQSVLELGALQEGGHGRKGLLLRLIELERVLTLV